MKNKSLIIKIIIVILLVSWIIYANVNKKPKEDDGKFKILTTFYPIYVMTLNITDGAENVEIMNMAEKNTGCIHDYTLSTEDLKKFEKTKVLVQNGKGLESFLDKITNSYPEIKIIDSSENLQNLIQDEEEENAHIWLSIENYISQVRTISEELQHLDEENKEIYKRNADLYIKKLNNLKLDFQNLKNVSGKKAICLNEALVYLLDEINIDATVIETDHEQSSLSAENIKSIINQMQEDNIKMIFIDKDDDKKTAEVLANETGATIYCLDSAMNGEAEKGAYIKAMEFNYNVLVNITD